MVRHCTSAFLGLYHIYVLSAIRYLVTLCVLVLFAGSLGNDDLVLASHCKWTKYTEKCHEHVTEIMYIRRVTMAT